MEAVLGVVCAPAVQPSLLLQRTYHTASQCYTALYGRKGVRLRGSAVQKESKQITRSFRLSAKQSVQIRWLPRSPRPGGQPAVLTSSRLLSRGASGATTLRLSRVGRLAGGLLWVGVLTFGVVSEQVKTRLEVRDEGQSEAVDGKEVRTEHSTFRDLAIGRGRVTPERGLLVLLDYRLTAGGRVLEDTKAKGRPALFTFGSRPLPGGLCVGVEEALASMRAGGRREITIPPGPGTQDGRASNATEELVYDVSLLRVSVPPS